MSDAVSSQFGSQSDMSDGASNHSESMDYAVRGECEDDMDFGFAHGVAFLENNEELKQKVEADRAAEAQKKAEVAAAQYLSDNQSKASDATQATVNTFAGNFMDGTADSATTYETWHAGWMKKVRTKFGIAADLVIPRELQDKLDAAFELENSVSKEAAWADLELVKKPLLAAMRDEVQKKVNKLVAAQRREIVFKELKEIAGMGGYASQIDWSGEIDEKMRSVCTTSAEKISSTNDRYERGVWLYTHLIPCLDKAIKTKTVKESDIVAHWRIWMLQCISPILTFYSTLDEIADWLTRNQKDLQNFLWEVNGKITDEQQQELDDMVDFSKREKAPSADEVLRAQREQTKKKKALEFRNRRTIVSFILGKFNEVEESEEPWNRYMRIQAIAEAGVDEEITLSMGSCDAPLKLRAEFLESQKIVKLITLLWCYMIQRRPMPKPTKKVPVTPDSAKINISVHFNACFFPVLGGIRAYYNLAQWAKAGKHVAANLSYRGFDTYEFERMIDTVQTMCHYRFPKELSMFALKMMVTKGLRELSEKVFMGDTAVKQFEACLKDLPNTDLSEVLIVKYTEEERKKNEKAIKSLEKERLDRIAEQDRKDAEMAAKTPAPTVVVKRKSVSNTDADDNDGPPEKRRSTGPGEVNEQLSDANLGLLAPEPDGNIPDPKSAGVVVDSEKKDDERKDDDRESLGGGDKDIRDKDGDDKMGPQVFAKAKAKSMREQKITKAESENGDEHRDVSLLAFMPQNRNVADVDTKKDEKKNAAVKAGSVAAGVADETPYVGTHSASAAGSGTQGGGSAVTATGLAAVVGDPNITGSASNNITNMNAKKKGAKQSTEKKDTKQKEMDTETKKKKEIKETMNRIFGGARDRDNWIRLCNTANLLGNDTVEPPLSNVIGQLDDVWEKKHENRKKGATSGASKKDSTITLSLKKNAPPPPIMMLKLKAVCYAACALQKLAQTNLGSPGEIDDYEIPSAFISAYNTFKSIGIQMKKLASARAELADPVVKEENKILLEEYKKYATIIENKCDQVFIHLVPNRDHTVAELRSAMQVDADRAKEILKESELMGAWSKLKPLKPEMWSDLEAYVKTVQAEHRLTSFKQKQLARQGSC